MIEYTLSLSAIIIVTGIFVIVSSFSVLTSVPPVITDAEVGDIASPEMADGGT